MNGTVTVLDKGAVRIHSYMSPTDTFHTTTQLIETLRPGSSRSTPSSFPPTRTRPSPTRRGWASRWTG